MTEEFKIAIQEFYPYFKDIDKFEHKDSTLKLQADFIETFPILSNFVSKSRQYEFDLIGKVNKPYRLLLWTTNDNLLCGWLCNIEKETVSNLDIIKEHSLLLRNIGGIQESFSQDDKDDYLQTSNQNFLFVKSECYNAGDNMNYYIEQCNKENFVPIDTTNLLCFVREANGNEIFYDKKNKEVVLFAHDHDFDNVIALKDQPEYTFYKFNEINTFTDYVEFLAKQWTELLKGGT